MEPRSVMVSYPMGATPGDPFSTSGLLISERWVLVHGTLLEPLFSESSKIAQLVSNLQPGKLVTLPANENKALNVQITSDSQAPPSPRPNRAAIHENQGMENLPNFQSSIVTTNGTIAAIWKCALVADTLRQMLSSWTFSEGPKKEKFAKLDNVLLPLFLLIRIERRSSDPEYAPRDVLRNFSRVLTVPKRGENVEINSTPFGNRLFMNSVTSGIVANVVGAGNSVILTDANAVLGCEGGPIFVKNESGCRLVCGMVIAPVSWCRGEWVGYTLGVNLLPCLQQILHARDIKQNSKNPSVHSNAIGLLDRSVVVVRCGSGWGSGILVDKNSGTILTCSHVVKEAPARRIHIRNQNVSVCADLIYKTPNDKPYDVAILNVNPNAIMSLKNISMITTPIQKGEQVVSAGFPFFSSVEHPSILSTVTRGNVSRSSECMLQTTCCIQSGASGGAVARPSGELLGMVVCNASSVGTNALFPRINMAIPTGIFRRPIEEYIETGDVKALKVLECDEERIQQMWNLRSTPSSKL